MQHSHNINHGLDTNRFKIYFIYLLQQTKEFVWAVTVTHLTLRHIKHNHAQ